MATATLSTNRFAEYQHLDEYQVLASICEDSYFEFFKHFNGVFIDEKMVYNWHVKYLCDELQKLAEYIIRWEPSPYDLVVNIPPGMTKSSIFSVAFAPWMWTRMQRFRQIVVTHTDLLGEQLAVYSRDIVLSDKYAKCWPHLADLREDQNTKRKWSNNFGGWRMAVTVGGRTPTGFHAHTITGDDLIDPEKADRTSALDIARACAYWRRTASTRKVNKQNVPTVLIGQRLDLDDPPGDVIKNSKKPGARPVKHICLPCDDTWVIKPEALKRKYKKRKGLLDPVRLPRSILKSELASLGNFGFAGQYGQDPLPKGGIIFDTTKFDGRIKIPPKDEEFRRIVRYWDKAYSQGSGAYTAGVKMGVVGRGDSQVFWVLDVVRIQEEAAQRERIMRLTANMDGRHVKIYIEQEPAAGKESVRSSIRNLAGFTVYADRRGGVNDLNKVMRADPYATQVNSGNVYLKKGIWNDDYVHELRYFSDKAKYKDQVDASSGAFDVITRVRVIGALD
jgi:predicted phage terminase large subunit-like protein